MSKFKTFFWLFVFGFLFYLIWQLFLSIDVRILKDHYPKSILLKENKLERRIEMVSKRPSEWTLLSGIARKTILSVIIREDLLFYQHSGIDMEQIRYAIQDTLEKGKFTRGASTITQQVVKNVFLTNQKSLWRKAREIILAKKLEKTISKKKILEIYFNIAEWGPSIYGINAAAWYYFKKNPSELNLRESAFLAILLPSPKRYSISFRQKKLTRYARSAMKSTFRRLVKAGYISAQEMQTAMEERFDWELTP